jgi:hypothetical protein
MRKDPLQPRPGHFAVRIKGPAIAGLGVGRSRVFLEGEGPGSRESRFAARL